MVSACLLFFRLAIVAVKDCSSAVQVQNLCGYFSFPLCLFTRGYCFTCSLFLNMSLFHSGFGYPRISKRAYNRWFVAVLLMKNPSLRGERRSALLTGRTGKRVWCVDPFLTVVTCITLQIVSFSVCRMQPKFFLCTLYHEFLSLVKFSE